MNSVQIGLEQIDVIRRLVDKYPTYLSLVTTAKGSLLFPYVFNVSSLF